MLALALMGMEGSTETIILAGQTMPVQLLACIFQRVTGVMCYINCVCMPATS